MANIQNLDTQQLVGLLKLKFDDDILIKRIKSTAGQGIRQKWAQKGEIKAVFKGIDLKVLFNTDYEFASIIFFNGISKEYYDEFITLMNAVMGQEASLRYSGGAITEWIGNNELAIKRLEKLTDAKYGGVEVLSKDLKIQLHTNAFNKGFQGVESLQAKCKE